MLMFIHCKEQREIPWSGVLRKGMRKSIDINIGGVHCWFGQCDGVDKLSHVDKKKLRSHFNTFHSFFFTHSHIYCYINTYGSNKV